MEIKKEITVTLSVKDVEKIIIEHLNTKGIKVSNVYFNIGTRNDPEDWRSEYPPSHCLDKVICKGETL